MTTKAATAKLALALALALAPLSACDPTDIDARALGASTLGSWPLDGDTTDGGDTTGLEHDPVDEGETDGLEQDPVDEGDDTDTTGPEQGPIDEGDEGDTDGGPLGVPGLDTCGNNSLEAGEACDGSNLGGASCEGQGYAGGTLACAAGCLELDAGGCTNEPQPGPGMTYGPCADVYDCAPGGTTICRESWVKGPPFYVADGFCSPSCAADSDCPSAGGTAVGECYDAHCQLNCAGGLTCPAGMVCEPLVSDNTACVAD
jgi:hypothetical protein